MPGGRGGGGLGIFQRSLKYGRSRGLNLSRNFSFFKKKVRKIITVGTGVICVVRRFCWFLLRFVCRWLTLTHPGDLEPGETFSDRDSPATEPSPPLTARLRTNWTNHHRRRRQGRKERVDLLTVRVEKLYRLFLSLWLEIPRRTNRLFCILSFFNLLFRLPLADSFAVLALGLA